MKVCLAIVLLTLGAASQAAGVKRPPHMTGDQLIAELRGDPGTRRLFDQHYALGYMAGVADATQGLTWCAPSGLTPEAVDDLVLDELAKQPIGSMPDMASIVVLGMFKTKFPATGAICQSKPRLSGDEFTVWLLGNRRQPDAKKPRSNADAINRERYAEGYVGGVVDATQDTDWCAPRRIKPGELDAIGYWGLLDRPRGSMPGNAAALLHEQFLAKYPCRPQNTPEKIKGSDAEHDIGKRSGIVAFWKLIPGVYDHGHIDIVSAPSGRLRACGSDCYWTSKEVWFWPLD